MRGGRFIIVAYLVVRDMTEAREVCDYLEGRGDRDAFLAKFARAASPGFDPDAHLRRIGVANQTTMLARESLAIGEEVGRAIERARGADARATDFRTFDTICSATQERQDAVEALLDYWAAYPSRPFDPTDPLVTSTIAHARGNYREGIATYGDPKMLHSYLGFRILATRGLVLQTA